MLRGRGNSTRGGRSGPNTPRGDSSSRGRGRGAASSSSKLSSSVKKIPIHRSKKWFESQRYQTEEDCGHFISSRRKIKSSRFNTLGNSSAPKSSSPFDKGRPESTVKREERGNKDRQNGIINGRGGRGSSRERLSTKSVRFTSPPEKEQKHASNIETTSKGQESKVPFESQFGGLGSGPQASRTPMNPFGVSISLHSTTPQSGLFGNPVASTTSSSSTFGRPSLHSYSSSSYPFDPPKTGNKPDFLSDRMPFGTASSSNSSRSASNRFLKAVQNGGSQLDFSIKKGSPQSRAESRSRQRSQANTVKNKLGIEIDEALRKSSIYAPSWPTSVPGDQNWKAAMESFWHTTKAYRAKARTYLMQNKLLDDPDKPKKLSEAIDFKGTCDDMCPEFEKITRIIEHDVHNAEKELSSDGKTYWPALDKMIKANARSAAGQDAPLPEDVRTPAALRRTLDYLIDVVLGENDLPKVHGFLWDRTRAIRRDFVFQQASMTSDELSDQVYCLELIARFHVVALHQMSHEDVVTEDFSEQQEVEQLGKTLLSLIHNYEDCMAQGIRCENEPEFRAYYVLFNSQDTGILEAVQDWGWRNWGESDEIRTAVSLVEALQNIWDSHGPLKPSATEIAPNVFNRYFNILQDRTVSYTMACFAEIHLNRVRKAAFSTILVAYRKQRDQTRDWSLQELNRYLHFDDEIDVLEFGEAYGLHFETVQGQTFLSLEFEYSISDPFPKLKQPHSYNLVERKRGTHSLWIVIHHTVYEDSNGADHENKTEAGDGDGDVDEDEGQEEDSFFVPELAATSYKQREISPSPDLKKPPSPLDDNSIINDNPLTEKSVNGLSNTKPQGQDRPPLISFESQKPAATASNSTLVGSNVPRERAANSLKTVEAAKSSILDQKSFVSEGGLFTYLNRPEVPVSVPSAAPILKPMAISPLFFPSETAPKQQVLAPTKTQFEVEPVPPIILAAGNDRKSIATLAADGSIFKSLEGEDAQNPTNASSTLQKIQCRTNSPNTNPVENSIYQKTTQIVPAESLMPVFAKWVAVGRGGLFDQFTEHTVEKILIQTVAECLAEETRKREQDEEMKSNEEAAQFRYRELATKYGYRWRELAHRLWMKRKGRLAREARRQMAKESLRSIRDAKSKDLNRKSRISGGAPRRHSADQVLSRKTLTEAKLFDNKTGKSYGVDRKLVSPAPDTPNQSATRLYFTNGSSARRSTNSQEESEDSSRRSLLSESAYLQGGSRIRLLSDSSLNTKGHHQPSGVKTDYFRSKARGVMKLPIISPLINTTTIRAPRRMTSLDDISNPRAHRKLNGATRPVSMSGKAVATGATPLGVNTAKDDDIEVSRARTRATLKQDKDEKQRSKKRAIDIDDKELFAKAKRIREQMDEGAEWFRAEVQKSMSRSVS